MFTIATPIDFFHQDTRLCVVANVAYLPKVYIHHYCHGEIVILKNLRISSKMLKREGLGEKQIFKYETYKNTVMPHERHIYAKAYDMEKATICAYSQSDNVAKLTCRLSLVNVVW